jgi:hypothetical protein
MPFAGVVYTRGNLAQAVSEVEGVCRLKRYSGWSLRGDPFRLNYSDQPGVAHICILQQKITDTHDVHLDSAIGTIHLFQVGDDRVKFAARPELLNGQHLSAEAEARLEEFWKGLDRRLITTGLKASSRDLVVALNATVPLASPDTGPLRR